MKLIIRFRRYVDSSFAIKVIARLLSTFLWMIGLFLVGLILFEFPPLPYTIKILVFYLFAGGISVYFTCKPIGFKRKNLFFCILAFFSVAFMPIIRLALQTRVRTWFVYLLFTCGILFWHFEAVYTVRIAIGGAECSRHVADADSDMHLLQIALSIYQSGPGEMLPLSFWELYQDKDAADFLKPLTLAEAERKYRYLPPAQELPVKKTLLIYERKPAWHFHSLNEGQFRVCAIDIDKKEGPMWLIIRTPKERYGGELRKIFFWYFINTSFKGPEELTPEEVQRYYEKQKIEGEQLDKKYGRPIIKR